MLVEGDRGECCVKGVKVWGPRVAQGLRLGRNDMWKPYLEVIAAQTSQALQLLEPFPHHDAFESGDGPDTPGGKRATASGRQDMVAQKLRQTRWYLLRRGTGVRGRARQGLNALLNSKLQTARAWEMKQILADF